MCQNEPLMDKDLFKKIQYVKKRGRKGIITMVVTNGSLFTEEKIEELEESGLDILNFSLDALTPETYSKIRKGLDFNHVLKNLENIIHSNYHHSLVVSFVKQKSNIDELQKFKKYWIAKGLPTLTFTICNRSGDLPDFDTFKLQNPKDAMVHWFKIDIQKMMTRCCISLLAEFNILWNGDVIVCSNDYSKKLVLGNVNDETIKDIWNGKQYQALRELHWSGEYNKIPVCRSCSIKERVFY